ncbi:MAG: sugar phosphate isomerase/epimerase [Planctomycetes bacterium]|nr:sugar phosphate isomerase/epimerase [Planctomycetota bacterium]
MNRWPLGVFSSIDAGFGVQLDVAHKLGVTTIHLHAPNRELRTPQSARELLQRLGDLGIEITCVFAGFDGESYADIPAVKRTVGLVPSETRAARTAELKEIVDFAASLKVTSVGLHLGFVPHDADDPEYSSLVHLTSDICGYCARSRQAIHLETGQEPADVLIRFIGDVNCDNLFINFDPANMILYGCGEPLEALKKLGPLVRSVHCKDAIWSDRPGETWGREVPLGEGAVNIAAYLKTLQEIGYHGPLTVEREMSQELVRQRVEIGGAIGLLKELKDSLG